jgi:hypothetical protein
MATNASTWFYAEPEHQAYLLEERVNHTFWNNRITAISLDCTHAEPPFEMVGEWHAVPLTIEWEPNDYFVLRTVPHEEQIDLLLVGLKEILGFPPTISYVDPDGQLIAEWWVKDPEERISEIQGNPNYRSIKRYKS